MTREERLTNRAVEVGSLLIVLHSLQASGTDSLSIAFESGTPMPTPPSASDAPVPEPVQRKCIVYLWTLLPY